MLSPILPDRVEPEAPQEALIRSMKSGAVLVANGTAIDAANNAIRNRKRNMTWALWEGVLKPEGDAERDAHARPDLSMK